MFISYSRKDGAFVRRLHAALEHRGREVWVDWEDIPATAPWSAELDAAIAAAGTFVFVLSPDSSRSKVCARELEHAVAFNKRILPIVRRPVDPDTLPAALSEPNWISFADDDSFDASVETLVTALDTDLDWVRAHTRLLVAALRWNARGRDPSLLLRGSELREAERDLDSHADKRPRPTPEQTEFVLAGRKAAARRQRTTLALTATALLVALGLGALWLAQRNTARAERDRAEAQARLATSRQLATQSEATVDRRLDLGLLLADAAVAVKDTPQARAALLRGISAVPQLRAFRTTPATVNTVAIASDGTRLAAGRQDGGVTIWGTHDLRSISVVPGNSPVTSLIFGRDGGLLALGRKNGTVEAWDVRSRRAHLIRRLHGPLRGEVTGLAYGPGNRLLAAADGLGDVALWGTVDGALAWSRRLPSLSDDNQVAFARRAGVLLYGDGYRSTVELETRTGKKLPGAQSLPGGQNHPAARAYSPDLRDLAVAFDSGGINLWDASSDRPPGYVNGPAVAPEALAFNRNGRMLASAGDGTLTVFDAKREARVIGPLRGFSGRTQDVALSPDGRMAAMANGHSVLVWDLRASTRLGPTVRGSAFPPPACCDDITAVALSADGNVLAWTPLDDTASRLVLANAHSGKELARKRVDAPAVDLLFAPKGHMLVSEVDPRTLVVRDSRTLSLLRTVSLPFAIDAMAFRRASASLVVISAGGAIARVNAQSGDVRSVAKGNRPRLAVGTVSSDGTVVATSQTDNTVLLRGSDGRRLGSAPSSPAQAAALALSPDGRLLAVAADDGTATVWDRRRRAPAARLEMGKVARIYFSPDARTLAAATPHGMIDLWDVTSGTRLGSLAADANHYVVDMAFSDNGRRLAFAGSDGAAGAVNLDVTAWRRIACFVAGRTLSRSERDGLLGPFAGSTQICAGPAR